MLTTSCPKCEKEVTVPSSAKAESRVRCPLCSEEYSLEHVFADLPPLLELLDAPSSNGTATHADEAAAESNDDAPSEAVGMFDFDQGEADTSAKDDGDVALADPVESVPKSSGFDFGDSSSAPSTAGGAATARKARPRQKGSPLKAIIGVVIGGLLAIPIAQLTLWWLIPGASIEQRDPMQLGQKLTGTSMQFLVPKWVRSPEGTDETAAVDPATVDPVSPPSDTDNPIKPSNPDEPGLGSLLDRDGNGGRKNPGRGGNNGGTNAGQGNNNNGGAANEEPDDGGGNSSSNNEEPPQPKSPIKDAPTYTASDLAAELKVVTEEVKRFDGINDKTQSFSERKAICDEFLAAAAKLAEVTTYADDKPDGHREHLNSILHDAASTADMRRWIGISANIIIKDENRSANGIVIAGEVTKINKGVPLHETVIALDTKDHPPVSVYGTSDPSKSFRVGEQVMILGVIIDKPAEKIRDYPGAREEPVVWGGYSQVVPKLDEE